MGFSLNSFLSNYDFTGASTGPASFNSAALQGPVKQPVKSSFNVGAIPGEALHLGAGLVGGAIHAAAAPVGGLIHDVSANLGLHSELNNVDSHSANLDKQLKQLQGMRNTMTKEAYGKALRNLTAKGQAVSSHYAQYNKDYAANHAGYGKVAGDVAGTGALALTAAAPFAAPAEAAAGNVVSRVGNSIARGIAGKPGAAKTAAGVTGAATTVVKKAAQNALVAQPTVQFAGQTANDAKQGNLPHLAEDAALVAAPVAVTRGLPKLASAAGKAAFGEQGGPLAGVFGAHNVAQAVQENPDILPRLQQAEHFTLNQPKVKGDLTKASSHLANHITSEMGMQIDQSPQGVKQFANNFSKYADTAHALQQTNPGVVLTHDLSKVLPVVKQAVTEAASHPDFQDPQFRIQLAKDIGQQLGNENPKVVSLIQNAVAASHDLNDINSRLNSISEKVHFPLSPERTTAEGVKVPEGFALTPAGKDTATMPKLGEAGGLTMGAPGLPGFRAAGNALKKVGLSPQATNNDAVRAQLRDNFDQALPSNFAGGKSEAILNTLQNAADAKNLADPRFLRTGEIKNALGADFTIGDAKDVKKALGAAYSGLSTSEIGVGNKVLNKVIEKVPGEAQYLRLQQKGRYDLNPFFYVKRLTKSAALSALEGSDFGKVTPETESTLEKAGYFDRGKLDLGAQGLLGESVGGNLKQVSRFEKRMVGSLAESVAKNNGTTVQEILGDKTSPLYHELDHALQAVIGYPKGGYLNSPLAKTLNLAIFPSRFDTKVLSVAGKAMGKLPPVAQAMVVKDVVNAGQWLQSSDGQKWQKDNSEVLGILKYFTPAQTIENVMNFASGGHHVSDLGEIGGLPIGVFTQILAHQGVSGFEGSQYLNPKTGEPVPSNIPTTDKARLQQAMTDFISSLFSYPGQSIGLGSKTKVIQTGLPALKPGKGETKSELANGQAAPAAKSVNRQALPAISPLKPLKAPNIAPANVDTPTGSNRKPRVPKKQKIKVVPAGDRISNSVL